MRKISILLALVASLFAAPAYADFTGKDASLATITFKNPNTCSSVVCVPVFQIYDGTNLVTLTTAGADAVSNTLTGVPVYGRNLVFNGTTWDRWQGGIKAASGAFASGSIASGAMVDLGSQADAACTTDNGTCSLIALQKRANQNLSGPLVAGSALAGGFKIFDTGGTNQATVKAASTPAVAGDTALVVDQRPGTSMPAVISQYPFGATALTASATGTTGATTATLAGTSGKTTYICSLSVRANATANTNVTNTVTGVITGTLSRVMWVPANTAGLGVDEQIYNPCVPASTTNTAIAVVSGAPGSGGVVTVNATGYQL